MSKLPPAICIFLAITDPDGDTLNLALPFELSELVAPAQIAYCGFDPESPVYPEEYVPLDKSFCI